MDQEGKQWDVVILDPPFIFQEQATIDKAVAGYKEINLWGMKLVKPGGFLVTSSCTNLVQPGLFLDIIQMAAADAKRKIRQVVLMPNQQITRSFTDMKIPHYLKFLIVQVL
ncbi:MAG: hypothetical protein IPO42_11235 [Chitinophagaceae bacterium]|nr:hypothetical protein [Chitinophagaceae bacterium]